MENNSWRDLDMEMNEKCPSFVGGDKGQHSYVVFGLFLLLFEDSAASTGWRKRDRATIQTGPHTRYKTTEKFVWNINYDSSKHCNSHFNLSNLLISFQVLN